MPLFLAGGIHNHLPLKKKNMQKFSIHIVYPKGSASVIHSAMRTYAVSIQSCTLLPNAGGYYIIWVQCSCYSSLCRFAQTVGYAGIPV